MRLCTSRALGVGTAPLSIQKSLLSWARTGAPKQGFVGSFFSAFLCVSLAFANDATFGGAGADLVPLEESRVQMLSEDILVEYRGRWHVTASYIFENATSNAVDLQVGFPEYRCQNAEEDCVNLPFRDLRTEVEGQPVQHRVGSVADTHPWKPYLGVVWLYDVTFPPNERTRVLHSYSIESGGDVEGNLFTTYVTRTGASWAKNIGRARFTFRLPAAAHTVVVPEAMTLRSVRTVDSEGPAPYVEVVCEEEDWDPKGDLFLAFNATARMAMTRSRAARQGDPPPEELCPYETHEDDRTAVQRQMCLNDEYAVAGYPFRKKSLQQFYYGDSADWHAEPSPWDTSKVWYVRGLQPFPGRPAWKGAVATSGAVTTPSTADSAALPPLPSETLNVQDPVRSAEARSSKTASEPANTERSSGSPAVHTSPSPVRERPGGCGCDVPGAGVFGAWPWIGLVLLGLGRARLRSGRR